MTVFIVLWPYLLTVKLRCLQKNNIEHTRVGVWCLKKILSALCVQYCMLKLAFGCSIILVITWLLQPLAPSHFLHFLRRKNNMQAPTLYTKCQFDNHHMNLSYTRQKHLQQYAWVHIASQAINSQFYIQFLLHFCLDFKSKFVFFSVLC